MHTPTQPYASLPQLVEGNGSNPYQSRFESEGKYQTIATSKQWMCGNAPSQGFKACFPIGAARISKNLQKLKKFCIMFIQGWERNLFPISDKPQMDIGITKRDNPVHLPALYKHYTVRIKLQKQLNHNYCATQCRTNVMALRICPMIVTI